MARGSVTKRGIDTSYPINKTYGQIYPVGQIVDDMFYFNDFVGLDYSAHLFSVSPKKSPMMINWRSDRGTMVQRVGTSLLGTGAQEMVIGLVGFESSHGVSYAIRIMRTAIEIYDPITQTWLAATGPAIDTTSPYSDAGVQHAYTTGWADHVIIQYDQGGMYELDPVTATYVQIDTTGTDDPSGEHILGKHITTFAGRIIVCQADQPNRMAWSAKDSSTDWGGIGSGFEDFFSTPGGSADPLVCCIPITDDEAIVVRENTIWLMKTTGNAEAPFRFTRLYDKIACKSSYGCMGVPGAAIVPGLDDIYIISSDGIKTIGTDIRYRYMTTLFKPEQTTATFDEKAGEYVMGIFEGNQDAINVIYRYNMTAQGWTRDEYPQPIKLLAYTRYISTSPTIIELPGTIHDLQGSIGSIGATSQTTGVMFSSPVTGDPGLSLKISELVGLIEEQTGTIGRLGILAGSANSQVFREDPLESQDWDANFLQKVDIPTVITTGLIISGSKPPGILQREKVTDIQLEYSDVSDDIPITIEWSTGVDWRKFSDGNLAVANPLGVSILRFAGTIEAAQLQIRMRTTKSSYMRMNGLHMFVTDGGRDNP